MNTREIKPNIHSVGAIDWDRLLFDELIPLPDGTSYNSYFIQGSEKTALLDTVDPAKTDVLIDNLKTLGVKKIDFIISHHAEQDHSGALPEILKLYPEAKIVTNAKCEGMLKDFLPVSDEKFIEIKDRETISLGDKTLEFIFAPWVHWPETIFSYLQEDKILFTCDLFGSHLAASDLFATDENKVYFSAKRYYAEIMMTYRTFIKKHLETIKPLKIEMIAPSHGPIYHKPEFILNAYRDWVSDQVKNEVIVPYVSMHGSTAKMTSYLISSLIRKGITVKPFNLSRTDLGELAIALVDAATIVIGSPTFLIGPHPLAAYASILTNALKPKTKFASIIGSFGWGSKMTEQISAMLSGLKLEMLPPVICKGDPKESDFKSLDILISTIVEKHKSIGIL